MSDARQYGGNLPPDVDEDIRRRVASGQYASPDEVIRAAMRALDRDDQEKARKLASFDQAIERGLADAEAGRVLPLDEAFAEVRKELGIPGKVAGR
ncbi:MAG: type II toxin-antitoxin system ParD family antitoxin [Xanthobacteraceae bacterium]|jgi:antitoxin ParD1/3/4